MGAFSWSRDKGGSGGKTHVAGAPVVLPQGQPPPAKRARVWKREPAGPIPAGAPAAAGGGTAAPGPSQQAADRPQHHHQHQDQGVAAVQQQQQQQQHRGDGAAAHPPPPAAGGAEPTVPVRPGSSQQQHAMPNYTSRDPAPATALPHSAQHHPPRQRQPPPPPQQQQAQQGGAAQQEAELEALRQQILKKQAQLQQAASGSREAEAAERERQKAERRQRLEAGFAKVFAEAKEAAAREIAASKAPVSFADAAEVARVLAAKSDYDVLKLQPGATGAAVRRRYRELAVTLHPDKCRSEGASEAFQRLVRAYQSLLQFAR